MNAAKLVAIVYMAIFTILALAGKAKRQGKRFYG
jgi:hypothetical protein